MCGGAFTYGAVRACHMRNLWKASDDPSRCDNRIDTDEAEETEETPAVAAATIVMATAAPLTSLARRAPISWEQEREMRASYTIEAAVINHVGARDMTSVQDSWENMLDATKKLCSDEFWKIFLQLHMCSTRVIDSALRSVKKAFVKTKENQKLFPISKRTLFSKMDVDGFWAAVRHTYVVNLSHFNLPSGTTSVVFKFVDPVWAWIMAAREQHPSEMHWKHVEQKPGNEVYGGGIQYGEWFKQACVSLPTGSYPMCVGLHWDGTSSFGVSSSPVCICVGNTNSCDRSTQYCVGYMPHAPDELQPEFKKTPNVTRVKYYIRQKCASAILRVLEEGARRGITCTLLNQNGEEVERVLFPRLSSMNFDQPEAQLFFGLQNKCCCSKCRRRKGYSAFRVASSQDVPEIRRLFTLAADAPAAREELKRWGFNYQRKCCLLQFRHLLVQIPGKAELYPGVDYRDRMHAGVIFIHRVMFEILDMIVNKAKYRRILDERLSCVSQRGFQVGSNTIRRQKSIFTDVGMSASDKSCVIFMLSHVVGLGEDTEIWAPGMLLPLQTAITHAQLILLALRGKRSYTKTELQIIFDRGYVNIFGAMETIRLIHYQNEVQKARDTDAPEPKRFRREPR